MSREREREFSGRGGSTCGSFVICKCCHCDRFVIVVVLVVIIVMLFYACANLGNSLLP